MAKKIVFIINPISGYGKQKIVEKYLKKHLDTDLDVEIQYTNAPQHATELSKNAADKNADIVVAVGGDGSVNEVCRGLVGSKTRLAIIPMGSGNGLARFLHIPRDISKAIEIINKDFSKPIDSLLMNNEFFINVAGIGFDAHIAKRFSEEGTRGIVSYIKPSLKDFLKFPSKEYSISIDDKTFNLKAFNISFANSSQYGNNAHIAPKAIIDDGFIEVSIISPFPKVNTGLLGIRLFTKTMDKSRYTNIIKAQNVKVESDEDILAHIDGEPIQFGKTIKVEIKPLSLNVIVPENYDSLIMQVSKNLLDIAEDMEPKFKYLNIKDLY